MASIQSILDRILNPGVTKIEEPTKKEFTRFSPIPEGYKFQSDTSKRGDPDAPIVTAPLTAKFSNIPGGGQYIIDPVTGDTPYKSVAVYVPKTLEKMRAGLSSRLWEIDHIIPLWAGGTDNQENKVKLTFAQHEHKTKIEAVTRELYYAGKLTKAQARALNAQALARTDIDIDEIKTDADGGIVTESGTSEEALAFAIKKKLDWEKPQKFKVGFKEVWQEIKDDSLLGTAGKSLVRAFTDPLSVFGLNVTPEQKAPEKIEDKVASAVGSIVGTIANFVLLEKTVLQIGARLGLAGLTARTIAKSTVLSGSGDIITAGRIRLSRNTALKAVKNAGLFSLQGQMSTQENDEFGTRVERFLRDATFGSMLALPGTSKVASDYVKNYGGLFAGSYAFSRLEGASNEDSIIGSTILVGIHGWSEKARINTEKLRGNKAAINFFNEHSDVPINTSKPFTPEYVRKIDANAIQWMENRNKINGFDPIATAEFRAKVVTAGRQLYKGGLTSEKRLMEDYYDTVSLLKMNKNVKSYVQPKDGMTESTINIFNNYGDRIYNSRKEPLTQVQINKLTELGNKVYDSEHILTGTGLGSETVKDIQKRLALNDYKEGDPLYAVLEKDPVTIKYVENYYKQQKADILVTGNDPRDIVNIIAVVDGKPVKVASIPTTGKSGYYKKSTEAERKAGVPFRDNINITMKEKWGDNPELAPQNDLRLNGSTFKAEMEAAGTDIIPVSIKFYAPPGTTESLKPSLTITVKKEDFVAYMKEPSAKTATEKLLVTKGENIKEGRYIFVEPIQQLEVAISTGKQAKVKDVFKQLYGGSKLSSKDTKALMDKKSNIGTLMDIVDKMKTENKLTPSGLKSYDIINSYYNKIESPTLKDKVRSLNLLGGKTAKEVSLAMAEKKAREEEPARLSEISPEERKREQVNYDKENFDPIVDAINKISNKNKELIETMPHEDVKDLLKKVKEEEVVITNERKEGTKVSIEKDNKPATKVPAEKKEKKKTWMSNVTYKKGEPGISSKALEYVGDNNPTAAKEFTTENLTKLAVKSSMNRTDIPGGWARFKDAIEEKIQVIHGDPEFRITNKQELGDLRARYKKMANSRAGMELNRSGVPGEGSVEQIGKYDDDIQSFLKKNNLDPKEVEILRVSSDIEYTYKEVDSRVKHEMNDAYFNELGRIPAIQGSGSKDMIGREFIRFNTASGEHEYYKKATGEKFITGEDGLIHPIDKVTGRELFNPKTKKSETIDILDSNLEKVLDVIPSEKINKYLSIGITAKGVENTIYLKYSQKVANLFKNDLLNEYDVTGKIKKQETLSTDEQKFLRVMQVEALGLPKNATDVDFVKRANLIYNRYDKNFSIDAKTTDVNLEILPSRRFNDPKLAEENLTSLFPDDFVDPANRAVAKTIADFPNGALVDGMFIVGDRLANRLVGDFHLDPSKNAHSLKILINTDVMINGVKTRVTHKGMAIREDKALRDMVFTVYGKSGFDKNGKAWRGIDPDGVTSFDTNAKFGPKSKTDSITVGIKLDGIYFKPLSISGRGLIKKSFESKLYSTDPGVMKDMLRLKAERRKDFEQFSKELMATNGAEEYNSVLDKWAERYNIEKEDLYYGAVSTASQHGAAKYKLAHEMDMFSKNLFYDTVFTDVLPNSSRVFVSAQLKLQYDGPNKPPRFLRDDEIVLGREFLDKYHLKAGEAGDNVMVLRDPSTTINNIRILKVIDGSALGHTSLGKEHASVSSKIERLVLQGDQDADTMLVVKVGEGGIPASYANAVNARGSKIVPFTEVNASPTEFVTPESVARVIKNQLVGDDQTSKIASVNRIITSLVDNKISFEFQPAEKHINKTGKEVTESKYTMFADKNVVEEGWTSPIEEGFSSNVRYGKDQLHSFIQAIQEALDSKKSKDIIKRVNGNDPYWALKEIFYNKNGNKLDPVRDVKTGEEFKKPYLGQAKAVSGALENIQRPFNIESILKEDSKLSEMIEKFEPTFELFRKIEALGGEAKLTPYQKSLLYLSDIKEFNVREKAKVVADIIGGEAVENRYGKAPDRSENPFVNEIYDAMEKAKKDYYTKDEKGNFPPTKERTAIFKSVIDIYDKYKEEGKFTNEDHKAMAIYTATRFEGDVAHARMYPSKDNPLGNPWPAIRNKYIRRFDDIIHDYPEVSKLFYKASEVKGVEERTTQVEAQIAKEDKDRAAVQAEKEKASEQRDIEASNKAAVAFKAQYGDVEIDNRVKKEPTIVEAPTGRVRPNGTKVNAAFNRETNKITIDKEAILESFKDKPWTNPKVEGVTPLPEKMFKTPMEWYKFHIEHEGSHTRSVKKANESKPRYEDRMNIDAIKSMDLMSRYNSLIKKIKKQPVQPTFFNTLKKKAEGTLSAEKLQMNKTIAGVTAKSKIDKLASQTTLKEPMIIYSDGSDIKGTGKLGFGAWTNFKGKDYAISGTNESSAFKQLQAKFPEAKLSNPTMEMLALAESLETFKNKKIHLLIRQDYKGAVNYNGLWQNAVENSQKALKPWKAKEKYIKYLVDRSVDAIDSINNMGGSVKIEWVPGHSGLVGNEKADIAARDRKEYNDFLETEQVNTKMKKVEETPFDGEGGVGDWFSGLMKQVSSWYNNIGKNSFTIDNTQKAQSTPAPAPASTPTPTDYARLSSVVAKTPQKPYSQTTKAKTYKVRGTTITDDDLAEAAIILTGEVSNRKDERQLEVNKIINTALNRMINNPKFYGSTLTEVLQKYAQYQAYAPSGKYDKNGKIEKSEYQKIKEGSADYLTKAKFESVVKALEALKESNFADTTGGVEFFAHATDGTLWLGNTPEEATRNATEHEIKHGLRKSRFGTISGLPVK